MASDYTDEDLFTRYYAATQDEPQALAMVATHRVLYPSGAPDPVVCEPPPPTPATALDLSTWGTFTRASEASYLIGTPTDGTGTPFMGFAPKDRRRIDRRGSAPRYLTERAVTNRTWSTESIRRGWAVPGGSTYPTTIYPAPDGGMLATRNTVPSGAAGFNMVVNPVTINQDWCASTWQRSASGTSTYQHLIGGSTVTAVGSTSLGTTWTRAIMLRLPDNTFGQLGFWINDGRNWSGAGGIAAGAREAIVWGMQLEQGSYPTSYMRCNEYVGATGVRAADLLSGPIASIPAAMVDGAWGFTVAPVGASSGMMRRNETQALFSFAEDASETVEFYVDPGVTPGFVKTLRLRVMSGGVAVVTSSALTFSADQELAVTLDGAAGSITVAGATTGNGTVTGTPWTRAVGTTLYVGSLADGSLHADVGLWCTGAPAPTWSADRYVVFTLGQSNMIQHGMHDKTAAHIQALAPDTKIIDGATGATSLATDWLGGVAYTTAITRWADAVAADASLTGYTPIVIWIQGEQDAANGGHAANYATNLPILRANLETSIPQLVGARWIVGQLSTGTTHVNGASATTIGQVRAGQASFVAGLGALGALIDPSDLAWDTSGAPNLHFDEQSVHTYAARIGAAAASMGVGA